MKERTISYAYGTVMSSIIDINNSISSQYKNYWAYTKIVLSKTGLGRELKLLDKKGTIKRKIVEFDLEQTPQSGDILNPLMKLYPEIFAD